MKLILFVAAVVLPLGGAICLVAAYAGHNASLADKAARQNCLDRGGTLDENYGGSAFTPAWVCRGLKK
jgi:hypothetical protein